ncbi:MAG: hypothetical protein ACRCVL_05620, partial [Cetobacterium sp.]
MYRVIEWIGLDCGCGTRCKVATHLLSRGGAAPIYEIIGLINALCVRHCSMKLDRVVGEMNVDEPENAAESSKREPKPTAKALAFKMEGSQKDRKAMVNKMKSMILSMKDLMKCDDNAPQVRSVLTSLKCLRDDVSMLHKKILVFLPPDELNKQTEWFESICKHTDGFVEDVEQWLNDLQNPKQSAQTTESSSTQSHANLGSSLSVLHYTKPMDNPLIPPSSVEPVLSSHYMHVPSEYQNLNAGYDEVQNQIQPTDSVSNVSRKTSSSNTTHGSQS